MSDLQLVASYFRKLAPIETTDLESLKSHAQVQSYRAWDVIFREGQTYEKIAFVRSGLLKNYFLTSSDKEFVLDFTSEGGLVCPYTSILNGASAAFTCVAVEETELLTFDFAAFAEILAKSPRGPALAQAWANHRLSTTETRMMEFLKNSEGDRFKLFTQRDPTLAARLRKQDLASYLGISPVTLSRFEMPGKR